MHGERRHVLNSEVKRENSRARYMSSSHAAVHNQNTRIQIGTLCTFLWIQSLPRHILALALSQT